MKFKIHLAIGFLTPLILYILGLDLIPALIIGASSILIDFDHYLWYWKETKNPNPFHAIRWYILSVPKIKKMSHKKRKEYTRGEFIFHNWIFWGILIFLGLMIHQFFIYIFLGFMLHIAPDLIELRRKNESIMQKISLGYVLEINKGKKKLTKI